MLLGPCSLHIALAPSLALAQVSESDLGLGLQPVLTEQQLLSLQSQGRCRNVFLNSLPVTVREGEEGGVEYCFNSVTNVNMFLFKKTNAKALGFVKRTSRNRIFLKIVPDDDGFFKLIMEEKDMPVAMCEQHGFRTKAIRAGDELVCCSTWSISLT